MNIYTKFTKKQKFKNYLLHAAAGFESTAFQQKFDSVDSLPVNIADGHQLINFISKKQNWNEIVRKLYIQVFFTAESKAKGSGIFTVYLLSKKILGREIISVNNIKHNARCCQSKVAFNSVFQLIDTSIGKLFFDVLSEIGTLGTLSIESTAKSIPALEINGGHKFELGIHNDFSIEKLEFDESKIVLVDGAIVNVSEIDYLLNDLSEDRTPCLLIARSFSNDIISTLLVNYKRKTLNVIPIIVKDSLTNINVIGDISVCTGAVMISAESGNRINSTRLNDCVTIDKVRVNHKKLMFDAKPELKTRVEHKIKKIKKKMQLAIWDEKMSADDIQTIFSKRIDSLADNNVKLWIPGHKFYVKYIERNFKFGIDYISSFANTGKVNVSEFFNDKAFPEYMPAGILEVALQVSNDVYNSVSSIGGCVEIDHINRQKDHTTVQQDDNLPL